MNIKDFDGMDTNDLIDFVMNELDQLRGKGGANPEELEEIQEYLEIIEQRYDEKDEQWQFECGVVDELKHKEVLLIIDDEEHEVLEVVEKGRLAEYLETVKSDPFCPPSLADCIEEWNRNCGKLVNEREAYEVLDSSGHYAETWEVFRGKENKK